MPDDDVVQLATPDDVVRSLMEMELWPCHNGPLADIRSRTDMQGRMAQRGLGDGRTLQELRRAGDLPNWFTYMDTVPVVPMPRSIRMWLAYAPGQGGSVSLVPDQMLRHLDRIHGCDTIRPSLTPLLPRGEDTTEMRRYGYDVRQQETRPAGAGWSRYYAALCYTHGIRYWHMAEDRLQAHYRASEYSRMQMYEKAGLDAEGMVARMDASYALSWTSVRMSRREYAWRDIAGFPISAYPRSGSDLYGSESSCMGPWNGMGLLAVALGLIGVVAPPYQITFWLRNTGPAANNEPIVTWDRRTWEMRPQFAAESFRLAQEMLPFSPFAIPLPEGMVRVWYQRRPHGEAGGMISLKPSGPAIMEVLPGPRLAEWHRLLGGPVPDGQGRWVHLALNMGRA